MAAPRIMGSALSWNARRRPIPSATEPLNRHPIKAPPKQMLTTSPSASVLPEKPRSAEMLSRGSLTTPEWYPKRNEVSVATQTCGSDMRHDGPATASVVALTAGNGENGFKISPLNFWVGEMGREDSVYELGVSTSGSMAASLDGTRLYTDELSFHRIAAGDRVGAHQIAQARRGGRAAERSVAAAPDLGRSRGGRGAPCVASAVVEPGVGSAREHGGREEGRWVEACLTAELSCACAEIAGGWKGSEPVP
jgi:hypothetical protein